MDLLDVIAQIAPTVTAKAAEAEEKRRLSPEVHQAMVKAGLFRMFTPKANGGLEVDVVAGFEAIEALAKIDSAAAWNLQVSSVFTNIAALFNEKGAKELFGDPNVVVSSGFSPPGAVTPVDGGFKLNGRWSWVSGCQNATYSLHPAVQLKDGAPEMTPDGPIVWVVAFPLKEAEIVDTWHSMGMRGTGSHDVVAKDIFIPADRATRLRPMFVEPNAVYGNKPFTRLGITTTILGNAVVPLGIARAAIDAAVTLVKSKVPEHHQTPPGQRSAVHAHLGRAEATLSAARAYFFGSLANAWRVAQEKVITMDERKHLQLAASYAAESAAKAVDLVHAAVGGHGLLEQKAGFARHFRDVHTVTQHALCSPTRFESIGQIMLGVDTDWGIINV